MTLGFVALGTALLLVWLAPYGIAAVSVRRTYGRWLWQIKRETKKNRP